MAEVYENGPVEAAFTIYEVTILDVWCVFYQGCKNVV
jgi:hypothetical protein